MKIHSFEDLFVCLLSDMYFVELQLVKDIPLLAKRAISDELKEGLKKHLAETKEHVIRIEKIFKLINREPKRVDWAMDVKSLFVDASNFLSENTPSHLLDAAIIAIAQRVEHFEIASYGTLRAFAKVLEYKEVCDLLDETIKEEGHADKVLSKLATGGVFSSGINVKATL